MLKTPRERDVTRSYEDAKEEYARFGLDPEAAMASLEKLSLLIHCWQADDIKGFQTQDFSNCGDNLVTGGYPGRARNGDELRADLDKMLSLIPGRHRIGLMTIYAEPTCPRRDWDEIAPEDYARWLDWGRGKIKCFDFLPTLFNHPKADSGFMLAHPDERIRKFWVDVSKAGRRITAHFGRQFGTPAVCNHWAPDGSKDTPADRKAPRERLKQSFDEIFAEKLDPGCIRDALEGKLFGLSSESYVVGSHEFYLAYAVANRLMVCMDTGHYHPTELVSDKISAVMPFVEGLLLHLSRGVRWDSDHVTALTDELRAIAAEIVQGEYLDRVFIGLDFFDASINRVAGYVIGAHSVLRALLGAFLTPVKMLRELEAEGDYTARLALFEEAKNLPLGAVWNYYCARHGIGQQGWWMDEIKQYEAKILSQRS